MSWALRKHPGPGDRASESGLGLFPRLSSEVASERQMPRPRSKAGGWADVKGLCPLPLPTPDTGSVAGPLEDS